MNRSLGAIWTPGTVALLAVPVGLALLVLTTSPNFRVLGKVADGIEQRSAPRGGDFVQEYIGGSVLRQGEGDRLYDLDYVRRVQHEPQRLGFTWPPEDYFPMVYPPFYYQFCQGLAGMPYPWAMRVWVLAGALAVSLTLALWWCWGPVAPGNRVGWLVGTLLFAPLLQNLNLAQKGSWLLLILTGTYLLLRHRRPGWAGLVFGLIAFKPHLGLVVGLGMAWQRQYRFCAGALAMVGLQAGLSWLLAPQLWQDYLQVVRSMGDYVQTGGYQLADSHSFWGAWQLLLGWAGAGLVKGLALVSGLALVLALAWRMRSPVITSGAAFARRFTLLVLAMPLLSPHFYTYDLTMLLLPLGLLVGGATGQRGPADQRRWRIWCLGFYALSGTFAGLAAATHVQWSVPLLVLAIVWLLAEPQAAEAGAAARGSVAGEDLQVRGQLLD